MMKMILISMAVVLFMSVEINATESNCENFAVATVSCTCSGTAGCVNDAGATANDKFKYCDGTTCKDDIVKTATAATAFALLADKAICNDAAGAAKTVCLVDEYCKEDGTCGKKSDTDTFDSASGCLKTITDCTTCTSANAVNKCTACKAKFELLAAGTCDNCEADGKFWIDTTSKCGACHDSCVACTAAGDDKCTKCAEGNGLVSGKCETCEVDNCKCCKDDKTKCKTCKDGYEYNTEENKCEEKATSSVGSIAFVFTFLFGMLLL